MKHLNWICLASIVAFSTVCACVWSEPRAYEEDLIAYRDDMERLCAGVLQGTIQDAAGDNDTVIFVPCEHDGEAYRLEIEVVSEMHCMGSEGESGVDCTHAGSGSIELSGSLEVDSQHEIDVTGYAHVSMGKGPGPLECSYDPHDDAVPHSRFAVFPEGMFPDQGNLEIIIWSRRHSAANEEPAVWEVCHLPIENHE
jgi:hypothetical protein